MGLMQSTVTEVANNMNTSKVAPENEITEPRSHKDWVSMDIGYGIESRYEVHDMYMTVKKLELEEWMKNYKGCNQRYSEETTRISANLKDNCHSGASFGGCLWRTKEVFQNGWYPKYSIHTK